MGTYCRGLLSDLARKERRAHCFGCWRSGSPLQEFLRTMNGSNARCATAARTSAQSWPSSRGTTSGSIGIIDERAHPRRVQTPGVQRHGAVPPQEDNCKSACIWACPAAGTESWSMRICFLSESWSLDRGALSGGRHPRPRCVSPNGGSLWSMDRAMAQGIRLSWLTLTSYGSKPSS